MGQFWAVPLWTAAVADALVATLWQGLLLTSVVALGLRWAGPFTAAVRSAVWTGVLALVVSLPALRLLGMAGAAPHAPSTTAVHARPLWGALLVGAWLVAAAYRLASLALAAWRCARMLRGVQAIETAPWMQALLGAERVRLGVSAAVDRPVVLGWRRPWILMPTSFFHSLTQPELEQIVLHEREHLRRGDPWRNLLQQLSLVLLPLHPAVLWLDQRLCREREMACDDAVLRLVEGRRSYAACLVKLAELSLLGQGIGLALSTLGTRVRETELACRVRRILHGGEGPMSAGRARLTKAGGLVFAGCLAMALGRFAPEMVAFEPSPVVQLAQTVPGPAGMGRQRLVQPTVTTEPQGRLVLTSADADAPGARQVGPGRPPKLKPVRRRSNHGPLAGMPQSFSPAAWQQASLVSDDGSVEARPQGEVAAWVLTDVRVSQPVFAAVPWRDGWLIVRL